MQKKPEFLTDYEFAVFNLTNEGKSPKIIADLLNSDLQFNKEVQKGERNPRTEQSIRKTRVVVRKKIERELQRIADALRLDTNLRNMPKGAGILIGYDWVHDTYVYLILTEGIVKVWYEHECSDKCRDECEHTLDIIRKERNIVLPTDKTIIDILDKFQYVINRIKGDKSNER